MSDPISEKLCDAKREAINARIDGLEIAMKAKTHQIEEKAKATIQTWALAITILTLLIQVVSRIWK